MPVIQFLPLLWASLIFLLLLAALSDCLTLTIPNALVLAVLVLYPLLFLVEPTGIKDLLSSLAAAIILFLGGFWLFSKGALGGGDVKLIAALGLFIRIESLGRFLMIMALAGGIIASAILILRLFNRLLNHNMQRSLENILKIKIPYGMAIAIAGLDFVAHENGLYS